MDLLNIPMGFCCGKEHHVLPSGHMIKRIANPKLLHTTSHALKKPNHGLTFFFFFVLNHVLNLLFFPANF